MSEKRKPKITIMLIFEANETKKRNKIELFEAGLWNEYEKWNYRTKFRMRLNGKWWPEGEHKYFYKTEIRDILWRSIPFY